MQLLNKLLQKIEEGIFFNSVYEVTFTQYENQRHYKKGKLQMNIPHEHRCKYSKQKFQQIEFNNTVNASHIRTKWGLFQLYRAILTFKNQFMILSN